MPTIFISYSNQDIDLVEPYVSELTARGYTIVYDKNIVRPGLDFQSALIAALDQADVILSFLTENGIASTNVLAELGHAAKYANEKPPSKLLIPLVRGTGQLPFSIERFQRLTITEDNRQKNIGQIAAAIDTFMQNNANSPVREKNYWLLKLNDLNWTPADLQVGYQYYFNSHRQLNNSNIVYPNFEQIQAGDQMAAYAYGTTNAILAIFEVTEALHNDPSFGLIINMTATRIITPPIPLESFQSKINFSSALSPTVNEKLFLLTAALFDDITQLPIPGPLRFNKRSFTRIATDSTEVRIVDELDFTADYQALAAVIAYKEFTPPLAIGLFGNWGSGKSFFMKKLEQALKDLTQKDRNTYCTHIKSVHFNSWHYSDANLWASLVTKIFDELKKDDDVDVSEKVSKIFSQLKSTLQLKEETEIKKDLVDKEIILLNEKKDEVEAEIKAQAKNLSSYSIVDVLRNVMNDEQVQKDIDGVKKEFAFVQLNEYKDIEASYQELDTATTHLSKGLGIVYSMRSGKLGLALVAAFLVWLASYLLITKVDSLKNIFDDIKAIIIPGTVVLTQFMIFIRPGLKTINKAYDRIVGLRKTVKAMEEAKIKETNQAREEAQANLDLAKNRQLELTQQITQLETKSKMLEKEIDNIASGQKLENFIASRVIDTRYTSNLGIISWIRKDFDELDKLLKEQRAALAALGNPPEKEKDFFIIDRIVLYIDDLDRCEADIVVKVLEAIHLLLAFPLFVVVVGVDPRWMHNALNLKYKDFLLPGGITPLPGQINANSYDYLEKIFQIPIVLKPIDEDGKSRLIKSQFASATGSSTPALSTPNPLPASPIPASSTPGAVPASPAPGSSAPNPLPTPSNPPQAPQPARTTEELLKVADEEITFMQDIGFLIGGSPRSIKRFINIYRIIRTHDKFRFTDANEFEHYCAAMIILAIMTGATEEAKTLFDKIGQSEDHTTFGAFLAPVDSIKLAPFLPNGKKGKRPAGCDTAINITMVKFKANLDLVCRFSFRDFS